MEKVTKPIFNHSKEDIFFTALKKDVKEIVERLTPKRSFEIRLKAILFPLLYIAAYCLLIWKGNINRIFYGAYLSMGILLVIIFLNNIHDAVHNTIFRSKKLNQYYVYLFDLMGANSYVWKLRHVRFHHNYPNVQGWDTDIEQSALVSVFPGDIPKWYHRYQHIYLPLIYPFYLLNWLLVRDFKDYFIKTKTIWKLIDIPKKEYVKLFVFKLFYLFYMIVIPYWLLDHNLLKVIGAFLLMIFSASIFSLIVLLSPHANTDSAFPVTNERGELPDTWSMHMFKTTNDIKGENFFTRFLMGNFNYHVVHHLFPNVNHIYYPEITRRIEVYAKEYGIPYRSTSLWRSLKSHYKLLKENGARENIFEETM